MSVPTTNFCSNQVNKFTNTTNNNQINLGSNSLQIVADNTSFGNTVLSQAGITNSITGQTAPFANLSQLPLLQTALYAVNQPPDQQSLAVNCKLYLENANPPTAPTNTITLDASANSITTMNNRLNINTDLSFNTHNISGVGNLTCQTLNYTTLNPAITFTTPTLAQVLTAGNRASTTLDMSGNSITNANIITATKLIGDCSGNATTATNATNVGITTDNTSGTYYIPFSKTSGTGNKPLFIDDTTGPLSYNPSTSVLTATTFSGALSGTATAATNIATTSDNTSGAYYIPFSKTTAGVSTALYLDDTTTPLTYNPSTSVLTATTFSTATAPVSGSQLGNKTYIDNFGGGAGWYYTASVNNGGASSTTFAFPNCFSSNLNNAYDVYFIFNFSAPTTGYINCNMSFTGLGTTTYYNWTTTTSNAATPTITNAFTSANAYLILLNGMDTTTFYYLRSATPKISIWGAISGSNGASTSITQFSAENFGNANPGITGPLKTWGYTQQSTGYITGATLTFSSAMTGTVSIIVKCRA